MPAPYAGLTPDTVLDALQDAALRGDGRLLALNSYENRVYQVWLEDGAAGGGEVLPPGALDRRADPRGARVRRASSPSARFPVVAPLAIAAARRCTQFGGFRFAVYPRRGGRAPELDDPRHARMDRAASSAASTRSARSAPFARAARARHRELRHRAARLAARPRLHSRRPARGLGRAWRRWRSTACATASSARATCARCACTATAMPATCCGPTTAAALRRLRRRAHGARGAGPVDAALGRPRRDDAAARATCSPATRISASSTARELHLVEALRTLRLHPLLGLDRAALGRSRVSRPPFRGSTRSATGRTASSSCASRSR